MAERMSRGEVVTVEELLRGCLYEQEALRRLLVRKGLLTDQEILDELQAVRRELETRRGR
jgi:predicted nucleic acid-binding protein